jgi:hypothetical protein
MWKGVVSRLHQCAMAPPQDVIWLTPKTLVHTQTIWSHGRRCSIVDLSFVPHPPSCLPLRDGVVDACVNHMLQNCQPALCQTPGTLPGSTESASARSCAPTAIHSAPNLHQVHGRTHAPTGTASWPWCGMGWAGPALELDTKPQAANSIPRASRCCMVTALQCTSLVACQAACTQRHTFPQQHLLSHCPGTQLLQLGRLGQQLSMEVLRNCLMQAALTHSHSVTHALARGLMSQTCSIMPGLWTAPGACM